MPIFKIEKRGTNGCENQIPLLQDDTCVGCYDLHALAAQAAKELGATEIDAYNVDDPESDTRHALKLKPDGYWCHTFSNL